MSAAISGAILSTKVVDEGGDMAKIRLAAMRQVSIVLLLSAVTALQANPDPPLSTHSPRERVPNLENGVRLFPLCAGCHGANGGGNGPKGIPAIAGQHFNVVVKQLLDYRYFRRWDPSTESLNAEHHLQNSADITDAAAYVSRLPRLPVAETGTGEFVPVGASVYTRDCAGCHGTDARSDAMSPIPNLAAQNYRYLLRQFHDAVEERRPNLAPAHLRLLEDLQRDELQGLADFLSRKAP
jgi:cytochrome c553